MSHHEPISRAIAATFLPAPCIPPAWVRAAAGTSSAKSSFEFLQRIYPRLSVFISRAIFAEGAGEKLDDVENFLAGAVELCASAELQNAAGIRGDDDGGAG